MAVGAALHAEVEGIPVVHRPEEGPARLREWHPWPGEKVTVRVTRPSGVPGRTLTIDHSVLSVSPGLRATDATLQISLRSSRGGQHGITLPAGSVLQSVSVNDVVQPIRLEGRRLTLPVSPGAHIYTRSKLPWVRLPESVPSFNEYYDSKTLWPAASRERVKALFG